MTTPHFVYMSQIPRVVFGVGSLAHLERELSMLGARRVLVLATPQQRRDAEAISVQIGNLCVGIYSDAVMHVPIETAREAREAAAALQADGLIAIGGGSTIGLGKAIALESGLPIIAIPTTYAGSEMTPIYGVTENGLKRTDRAKEVLPKTVIYDPLLTLGMPKQLSVASAMNAIAHAVEGMYAPDPNPVSTAMAEEALKAFWESLPTVVARLDHVGARTRCLYGAWMGGTVLGAVNMGLHHQLCHTLGGSFNLPHAETHAIVLPHVLAYNNSAAPETMARIEKLLGTENAAGGLFDFAANLGAPVALSSIGMRAWDLDRAAEIATEAPYYNPRPVDRRTIRALLDEAFHGQRPYARSSARRLGR